LVVRCDPGAAPGIGRVIDELDHEAILGCVAGDDTVILVSKDSVSAGPSASTSKNWEAED